MNFFVGIGRLVADPEATISQSGGKVARYRIAINRPKDKNGNQEADFIRCVSFKNNADFAESYFRKGAKIYVIGKIRTGSYEKNGQKYYTFELYILEHGFCESKAANTPNNGFYSASNINSFSQSQSANTADFTPIDSDEGDLPFKQGF